MSTALHPLSAYMEPPTAPDDTKQCASCRLPSEGTCFACGEPLCEEHGHQCDRCHEIHCRPCLRFVDDVKICRRDWAGYVEDEAAVIEYENERAEEKKRRRTA